MTLYFSEPMQASSVTNTANYKIDNGIVVNSAAIGADSSTVLLTTSPITSANRVLTVNGLRDLDNNLIVSNSQVTINVPLAPQRARQQDSGSDGLLVLETSKRTSQTFAKSDFIRVNIGDSSRLKIFGQNALTPFLRIQAKLFCP